MSRSSGQRQSTRRPPAWRFILGSARPAARRRVSKRDSSRLSVIGDSPSKILLSRLAPRMFGRLSSKTATSTGVVLWRTPASWHARFSASSSSDPAMSTSVRATGATGTPRHVTPASVSVRRRRRVATPWTRRSVGAVTSAAGADPLMRPSRCAAARPLSTALAAGEHSGEIARLLTRRPVPDPVDASVLRDE